MKTYRLFSLLALLGLSACGSEPLNNFYIENNSSGTNPSSSLFPSNETTNSIFSEALSKPNETTIRGFAKMISQGMNSNEITSSLDLKFKATQNRIETNNDGEINRYDSRQELDIKGDAFLKTNDMMGVFPQAILEVNLDRARQYYSYNNSEPNLSTLTNQKVLAYYESGDLYVDFEDAPEIYPLIIGDSSSNLKIAGYLGTPEELGLVLPTISEEEINTIVNELSPVFASVTPLRISVFGNELTMTFELTQEDFVQSVRNFLKTAIDTTYGEEFIEDNNISSQELDNFIDEAVEEIASMFEIRVFKIQLITNVVSGFFQSIKADIDIDFINSYSGMYSYDIWNGETYEYEETVYSYENEEIITFDLNFVLSMRVFTSNQIIAIPINKEEFSGQTTAG